jgi:hypothetical protein
MIELWSMKGSGSVEADFWIGDPSQESDIRIGGYMDNNASVSMIAE